MSNTVYTINTGRSKPSSPSSKPPKGSKKSGGSGKFEGLKKKLNRPATYVTAAILLLLGLGIYFWMGMPPSLHASAKTLAIFQGSDSFKAMPADKQKQYYEAYRAIPFQERMAVEDKLTDAQRDALHSNQWALNPRNHNMEDRWKAFQNDHTAAGKRAQLQKMIDQMEANQPSTQPSGQPNGGGNRGGGRPGGGPPGGGRSAPPGDMQTPFREMRESMAEVRMENGLPSHR